MSSCLRLAVLTLSFAPHHSLIIGNHRPLETVINETISFLAFMSQFPVMRPFLGSLMNPNRYKCFLILKARSIKP